MLTSPTPQRIMKYFLNIMLLSIYNGLEPRTSLGLAFVVYVIPEQTAGWQTLLSDRDTAGEDVPQLHHFF